MNRLTQAQAALAGAAKGERPMNRQTFLRSFAVAALALTAVACTTDADDPLTASDPGPAPAATAPAGAASGAQGSTATDSAPQEITIVTLD
jgi:hypothetical protein